ncbi:unnamed protein product [Durusdinium trenchii]
MMATCVAWRLEDRRGNVFDLKSRGNAEGRLFQTQAVGVPCVKGPLDECKLTSPDCGSPRSPTATPRSRTTPCRSASPYSTPPPAPRRAPPTCELTSPDCGSPRSPTATPRSRTTPCRSPSPYPTPPPAPRRAPPTPKLPVSTTRSSTSNGSGEDSVTSRAPLVDPAYVNVCGPLHKALIVGCPFQVRQVLEEDPAAADMPFMDHDFEPPICACVRLDCSVEILKLLLAHGASVNVRDVDGHTALSLLSSNSCRFRPLKGDFFDPQAAQIRQDQRMVYKAQILLDAGCPLDGPGGIGCLGWARRTGNVAMAKFLDQLKGEALHDRAP